jgi:error-prone DNA polymerase
MARKGISAKAQEEIVLAITSFALYGFPESHAASFALIAYASAYLKCHYLAAFTAAILNNQPMGFYQPFTLVKDAQRHGLVVRPVDVTRSNWLCTIEKEKGQRGKEEEVNAGFESGSQNKDQEKNLVLRLGLRYVKGLSEVSGKAIVRERMKRPFRSIDDLHYRVPELRKDELRKLAAVGAFNFIGQREDRRRSTADRQTLDAGPSTLDSVGTRRDALWQVERVARAAGELYEQLHEFEDRSPLAQMTRAERMNADFRGTGLTIGHHPVAYHRAELNRLGACRAIDIQKLRDGTFIKIGGWVIVRQRPGTAKGFVFLTMEDETGVANVIITPQLFDKYRLVLVDQPFLLISGKLQNQDNVISVKAKHIRAMSFTVEAAPSHDFH